MPTTPTAIDKPCPNCEETELYWIQKDGADPDTKEIHMSCNEENGGCGSDFPRIVCDADTSRTQINDRLIQKYL